MSQSPHPLSHEEELTKLREHFNGACRFLAKTRLNDKRSLNGLPWYILLGPSQAGKTSLLAHSEQEFILAKRNHRLNAHMINSTQHFDWWATQEAVYVDLSGQFTAGHHNDSTRPLWQATTRLLANYYRSNQQLGVIVVISAMDLLATREQLLALAEAIRQQLLTLRFCLKHAFPLHLIVNKFDCVNGFAEFFDDLSREERSQLWGFSCNSRDPAFIDQRIELLLSKLNDQLLFRLQQQLQLTQRAHIHNFPLEIANLKPRLLDFIHHAIPASNGLIWQSIYFTSCATQPKQDNIIGKQLAHLHTAFQEPVAINDSPRAYFIQQLFNYFTRHQIYQAQTKQNRTRLWYKRGAYLVAACIITLGASAWAYAFNRQLAAIHHTEQVLAKYQVLTQNQQTQSLAQQIVLLDTLKQAGNIATAWWSASKVRQLKVKAAQTYQLALQKMLLPTVTNILSEQLTNPVAKDPAKLYAALQGYLMLADNNHRQASFIENQSVHYWQTTNDYNSKLLANLKNHLHALLNQPLPAIELKEPLIAAARLRLNNLPLAERSYTLLHNLEWHPELELYTDSQQKRVTISGFYTKESLMAIYAQQLTQACQQAWNGNWVLGKNTSAKPYNPIDLDDLKAQVSDLYLADYAHHWQRVLAELSELSLGKPEQINEVLDQLLNTQSKLNLALNRISENTQITSLTQGQSDLIARKFGEKFADFRELQAKKNLWQTMQLKIRQLQIYLLQMKLSGNFNEAAYTAAKTRMLAPSLNNPISDLNDFAKQLPNPWQSWLPQLTSNSWQYVITHASSYLEQVWQDEVFSFYQQSIANRFPFAKASDTEVSINDFNKFFAPDGILNHYFTKVLKPFLDTSNTRWQLKTLDNQHLAISNETLTTLQQAAIIQKMFYPQQQTTPMVKFNLAPLAIDVRIHSLQLSVDGQTINYPNGTESLALSWQGQQTNQVKMRYQDKAGIHQVIQLSGPWSFFRFLAKGSLVTSANPKHYVLALNVDDNLLQFELNATEPINPFAWDLLTNFKLPEHLG